MITPHKSSADMLADIGRALYGGRWRKALADALDVDERQVRRWLANGGATLTPEHGIFGESIGLLGARAEQILRARSYLKRWRKVYSLDAKRPRKLEEKMG